MQCHEMRYPEISLLSPKSDSKRIKTEKEAIHSGHFMVSHFEAEAQDDEYEVAVPVPEMRDATTPQNSDLQVFNVNKTHKAMPPGQLAIDTTLTKLFQCMSLAYRQKLTSPKWNRFRGIRLRWKDKIRLNNVIWRCWHMQFIKKENTLICQFASPLDEGTHNKPEAVVLEGKYWKRKLAAVTAEYKRWRMFYRNKIMGWANKDTSVPDMDTFDWQSQSTDSSQLGTMMVDEDYMELMSDTLFSTITSNQPFAFPDTREIAKGANLADFIQPSLVQLQPNIDDFMDTFEPFQEIFSSSSSSSKLPPVPEDCPVQDISYRSAQSFPDLTLENQSSALPHQEIPQPTQTTYHQAVVDYAEPLPGEQSPESKAARFYHSKHRSQTVYPAASPPQPFVNPGLEPGEPAASSYAGARPTTFVSKPQQQTFRMPSSNSKMFKYPQYQKMAPPTQYARTQQSYELSVGSQESLLPEVSASGMIKDAIESVSLHPANKSEEFAVPQQQALVNLKGRQRTRSGSSIVMAKSKPPPLSTANSDSALNISSALLAQLLTTNNPGVYNITSAPDRVRTIQPVLKSANIPIMPSPPKAPHQKMLSMTHSNTLLITDPALTATQGYLSAVRPSSSPESPAEGNRVQNLPSPGNLSQSPTSPLIFTGPISPSPPQKQESSTKTTTGSNEHRRVCHINAEQKRRYNIKNGFDVLHSLIPHSTLNPNVKLSKAVMLQKGAEYIRQLQVERSRAKEDMRALKYQIETLSASISNCQSLLPATGAPVSHHRTTKMKEMFDDFVRMRTAENWKFWIFSVLFEPLLQSFNCSVSTASYEDLYRSTLIWVEQHCSLVELRPAVLNSLKNLCTATEILSNPSKLPEEARAAVNKKKS